MTNFIRNIFGIFFALAILGVIFVYFKSKENEYDSVIEFAVKQQREHTDFINYYGEDEPPFPDKILNSKTITGIDTNKNGVRDDIDVWINRTAYNMNETKAMRQYAKAMQISLIYCESQNQNEKSKIEKNLLTSTACLASISDYQRKESGYAKKYLDLLTLNTEARKACWKFLHEKSSLEESKNFYCDFEIQYLNNVVFGNKEWQKGR